MSGVQNQSCPDGYKLSITIKHTPSCESYTVHIRVYQYWLWRSEITWDSIFQCAYLKDFGPNHNREESNGRDCSQWEVCTIPNRAQPKFFKGASDLIFSASLGIRNKTSKFEDQSMFGLIYRRSQTFTFSIHCCTLAMLMYGKSTLSDHFYLLNQTCFGLQTWRFCLLPLNFVCTPNST